MEYSNRRRVLTIDDLPDDDLLEIFDFYVVRYQDLGFREFSNYDTKRRVESWKSLVHVCRRWRGLVFGSPRRLNLQLLCIPGTSLGKTLDVWPPLPLLIKGDIMESTVDSVIAILKHSDRICQIELDFDVDFDINSPQCENLFKALQVPFPELVVLYLSLQHFWYWSAFPESFLGGSAPPRLRFLNLVSVSFPGFSSLLSTATHLVNLYLHDIPHSGHIPPEEMATCLSMLTSLETLHLSFDSRLSFDHRLSVESYPDRENRRSLPPTRSILPVLTSFSFKGTNEYLDDLVSRIDAPQLHRLSITFFDHLGFDAREIIQFIRHTPTFGAYNETRLIFHLGEALVKLDSLPEPSGHRMVEVKISSKDWQLASLTNICTSSLRLLLTTENLYIGGYRYILRGWTDLIEGTKWLDLLLPFTAVKNLYLSKHFLPRITPALQELTGVRTTEVLPALKNVFLEGFQPLEPVQEVIAQFISARQLANRPVTISVWHRDPVWDKWEVGDR